MDGNPKQQVAEKLRSSNSVLVTVSNNPSVDQLSSAIGLSLMLNKLGKHTTAVFSGSIPNAIQFLHPEKTFDSSVDGLRDFIILLDKDKADKLRYKVEDNTVKIFITPYKSKISEKDLEFSQGDFNVDLVVALGVHKREDLDNAITAHGRILHDATIITINSGDENKSNLGSIDWYDSSASCLAEMLVSISEALEGGLLDAPASTAFLTSIVATTDRFKNEKTTPKIMTMSAQLMAAGANQQLIATNLQPLAPSENSKPSQASDKNEQTPSKKDKETDGEFKLDHSDKDEKEGKSQEFNAKPQSSREETLVQAPTTTKGDNNQPKGDDVLSDIEDTVKAQHRTLDESGRTKKTDNEDPALKQLEDELSHDNSSNLIDLESQLKSYDTDTQKSQDEAGASSVSRAKGPIDSNADSAYKPSMGGTFNATAEEAHDQTEQDRLSALNKEILSHKQINPSSPQPEQQAESQDNSEPKTNMNDVPDSQSLMRELEDARREVEAAMDESQTPSAPSQALNAAPLSLDNNESEELNLPQAHDAPQQPIPPAPSTQQQPQYQQPQAPQQPVNFQPPQPQGLSPYVQPSFGQQPSQAPQNQSFPQQQPQAPTLPPNPLFAQNDTNQYQQPQAPQINPPQQQPQYQQPQAPQQPPSQAPPMPPTQAPPMPPFN